ncbi:MAG: TolC family outer membrane protein [Burkholderiaceae bacterium]|nr:TolC family outer membrane protein [Burkholderiaceae bacterium]
MTFSTSHKMKSTLRCIAILALSQQAKALSLLQAYEAALANDPAYLAAIQENLAGQQYKVIGRAGLLPNISANYSKYKNRAEITTTKHLEAVDVTSTEPDSAKTQTSVPPEDRKYSSYSGSIQLRQPLFNLDALARYQQGISQTQASDAQFVARSQDLILRLASLYSTAKYNEDQLAQAISQRDAYAEQQRANERMLQSGEGTKTEVLEAQAKFDLAEAQVLEARDDLAHARNSLASMIGQEVTELDSLTPDFVAKPVLPNTFELWKAIALERNAEISIQKFLIESANQEVKKSWAGHVPKLDLVASVSKNNSDTVSTFEQNAYVRSIGVQLSVPLYAGGAVSAITAQAIANFAKAQADLDAKTKQVLLELRKHHSLTVSGVLRIAAAEKSLNSALLLVDATQKSVKGGVRTNLDVLNAKHQVFEARRDLELARYNFLLSTLRLRFYAGTLGADDLKEIATYLIAKNAMNTMTTDIYILKSVKLILTTEMFLSCASSLFACQKYQE